MKTPLQMIQTINQIVLPIILFVGLNLIQFPAYGNQNLCSDVFLLPNPQQNTDYLSPEAQFLAAFYQFAGRYTNPRHEVKRQKLRQKDFALLTKFAPSFYRLFDAPLKPNEKFGDIEFYNQIPEKYFGKMQSYNLVDKRVAFDLDFTFEKPSEQAKQLKLLAMGSKSGREFGRFIVYFKDQSHLDGPIFVGKSNAIFFSINNTLDVLLDQIEFGRLRNQNGTLYSLADISRVEFMHNHSNSSLAYSQSSVLGGVWVGSLGLSYSDLVSQIRITSYLRENVRANFDTPIIVDTTIVTDEDQVLRFSMGHPSEFYVIKEDGGILRSRSMLTKSQPINGVGGFSLIEFNID